MIYLDFLLGIYFYRFLFWGLILILLVSSTLTLERFNNCRYSWLGVFFYFFKYTASIRKEKREATRMDFQTPARVLAATTRVLTDNQGRERQRCLEREREGGRRREREIKRSVAGFYRRLWSI